MSLSSALARRAFPAFVTSPDRSLTETAMASVPLPRDRWLAQV